MIRNSSFIRNRTDGASLFYTTQQPTTLHVLRQYTLHLLFVPPAPSPITSTSEAPTPLRNPFVFHHKPNTLDRDRIVVPAGWDSWGKIGVLREGFDAKAWGEAWEADLDANAPESDDHSGARKMYRILVPDQGVKVSSSFVLLGTKLNWFHVATSFTSIQCPHGGAGIPGEKL